MRHNRKDTGFGLEAPTTIERCFQILPRLQGKRILAQDISFDQGTYNTGACQRCRAFATRGMGSGCSFATRFFETHEDASFVWGTNMVNDDLDEEPSAVATKEFCQTDADANRTGLTLWGVDLI